MNRAVSDVGFTLVETLLAVFALALLMSAGGALLFSTLNSSKLVDARLDRLNKLEVMTAHMRADLGGAVPRLAAPVRAGEGRKSLYGGEADRDNVVLGLVRSGWLNIDNEAARSQLLAVEYKFEDGMLFRRLYQSPDRTRQTPVYETLLVGGLSDVDVRFSADGQVANNWGLALSNGSPVMPDTVTFEMAFEDGQTLAQNFLVGGRS